MTLEYKITYFPSEALCEPIRWLFAYAGIEYEDFRFERADWLKIKPNMPFGQVPILEYHGKVAHQNLAIARYLAKKGKLIGNNDWEDLEIDAVVDTINDLRTKIADYFYETDLNIKASLKQPLFEETIPYYLKRLDENVNANNGFLALKRLTWTDIYFVALALYLSLMREENILTNYKNLIDLQNKVLELPAIKNWIKNRPAPR